MPRAPRLIWASNETPCPNGNGGQRRQFHVITSLLAQGIDVSCVLLQTAQSATAIQRVVPRAVMVRQRRWVLTCRPPRPVRQLLHDSEPDALLICHTESVRTFRWLIDHLQVPTAVEIQNLYSLSADLLGEDVSFQYRRVEDAALALVDVAVTLSANDAIEIRERWPALPVIQVMNGFDPAEWPSSHGNPDEPPHLAFFGSLWWVPNVEGLRWFAQHVWPSLLERRPGLTLHLLGAGDLPEELSRIPGFVARGWVPELHREISKASVVVLPLPAAPGAPVKFPEALASGRPVVATRHAARGVESPPPFRAADSPAEFASAVLELLDDRSQADRLASDARTFAERELGWDETVRPLVSWLRRLKGSEG